MKGTGRLQLTARTFGGLSIASVLVITGAAMLAALESVGGWELTQWRVVLLFMVAIVGGERFPLVLDDQRQVATISVAAAYGFVLSPLMNTGVHGHAPGASFELAVIGLGMTLGLLWRHLSGLSLDLFGWGARFVGVLTVALMVRQTPLGELLDDGAYARWATACVMVAVCAVGIFVDVAAHTLVMAWHLHSSWTRLLADEAENALTFTAATGVTGALIALAEPAIGFAALPLFLIPLVVAHMALRRFAMARQTYGQTIAALSRMTEPGAYTRPGHADRVAALCLPIARDLGLSEREVRVVRNAALLHDIGQVALITPIPGGATLLAADADRRAIAEDTARIIAQTGVLDDVAEVLAHQVTPYRHVIEQSRTVPLASRIIHVVNAFDDLTAGQNDAASQDAALERIYLGLGYEYDPRVVQTLNVVVQRNRLKSTLAGEF